MTTQLATKELAKRDPVIAALVKTYGPYTVTPHTDYYWELVDGIISQQISVKAARSIEQRFLGLFDGKVPTADQLLTKTPEELRAVGMSNAKASYVLDLAAHIADGRLIPDTLPKLSNEDVIKELTAVKGIGTWTAHMFLLFALGRLDILPIGDLGLRIGVQKVFGLDHLPTPAEVTKLSEERQWNPYESIATWYIWRALDNKPALEQ